MKIFEGAVMDAAPIGAAQRVEGYEIAAYGTVSTLAKILSKKEDVLQFGETPQEEKDTDGKLTELAQQINPQANEELEAEEENEENRKKVNRGRRVESRN